MAIRTTNGYRETSQCQRCRGKLNQTFQRQQLNSGICSWGHDAGWAMSGAGGEAGIGSHEEVTNPNPPLRLSELGRNFLV